MLFSDTRFLCDKLICSDNMAPYGPSKEDEAGPPIWPVMGMLSSLFLHVNDIYDWVTQVLTDCGGTLEFKPSWMENIFSFVTTDPKSIEYILKTKFCSFPKDSYYKCILDDLLG